MSMSIMFEKLGARLRNNIWSWGAATENDKIVYFRVWNDEQKIINGKRCVHLLAREKYEGKKNLGYEERLKHIELIKDGAECFLIFCEPKNPVSQPRKVADYIKDKVFPAGAFVEYEGDLWIEHGGGTPLELHFARYEPLVLKPAA